MNQHHLTADDLVTVAAIAESGSLSGAARALSVNHATVYRRLQLIEVKLATRLFERSRSGYVATPAGEAVAQAARRVEEHVLDVERQVAGQDLQPSGTVRITTTDSLLFGLLTPMFARFRHAYPRIVLEVVVSNQLFDLSRREADVAIRPSQSPPERLLGRRLGVIEQAVYGGMNHCAADITAPLNHTHWIGPDERLGYRALDSWMAERGFAAQCSYRVDSVLAMMRAVEEGIGLAVLPCYLADRNPHLVRIGEPIPELATDLWFLSHPDLRSVARLRALSQFMGDQTAAARRVLAGI